MLQKLIVPALLLLLQTGAISAQTTAATTPPPRRYLTPISKLEDAKPFADLIQAEGVKKILLALTSKEFEGRETGQPGQKKAADFIANQFKEMGLPKVGDRNTYFQFIALQNESWSEIGLTVGEQKLQNRKDFFVIPAFNPDNPLTNLKEVVFVGYGVETPTYSDYEKTNVKGKAVLFYSGEPMHENGKSLVTGTESRSEWALNWRKKVRLAKEKGAVVAFIVDQNFSESVKANRKMISNYGWQPVSIDAVPTDNYINNVFISPETANLILGKKAEKSEVALDALRKGEKFKAISVKQKIALKLDKENRKLEGSNIVAFIEGSDPELKKEYVFVTAHYDHLGMPDTSVIYYGADDNASGSSGVVEIARAFAEAKKKGVGPKRSVVCMLVSGEEKGLLGSRYYVELPLFPLSQTVVDINIDMIGRIDAEHEGKPDYVYVIGSDRLSTELHDINEQANAKHVGLELDYKYNAPDDPNHFDERSDHYNFAERGIPAIFYFNGVHPDYHKPTDTPDKINTELLAKRARLAFYTAWEIANRPARLLVNKQ